MRSSRLSKLQHKRPSPGKSVLPRFLEFCSNPQARQAVELQQFRCCAPYWRLTDDVCSLEAKMDRPCIASRVEKRNNLARAGIHGGNVRAFPPIAVEACQSKVLDGSRPTVLCCNHMIRFVCHHESFWKKAIFAKISGSNSDLIAQRD
jgi:hypothetical protein